MSDDSNNGGNAPAAGEGGDNLAELRAAADRGRKAERENAFLRAGVDLESPVGKMFAKGFDGDIADIDGLKASAKEVGAIKEAPAAPPANAPTAEELAATALDQQQQRTRDALSGGAPSGDEPPATADPYDDALGNFHAEMAKGVPRDRAGLGAIDRLLDAAGKGDKRVFL